MDLNRDLFPVLLGSPILGVRSQRREAFSQCCHGLQPYPAGLSSVFNGGREEERGEELGLLVAFYNYF